MDTVLRPGISFYQSLGKLFYAIAAADKIVREKEYDTLKKAVKLEWLTMDDYKDEYGSDVAFQIEIVFDWLAHLELPAEECFKNFTAFKEENESLFDIPTKQFIWKVANRIAASFAGKNKSELIMLAKLKMVLGE